MLNFFATIINHYPEISSRSAIEQFVLHFVQRVKLCVFLKNNYCRWMMMVNNWLWSGVVWCGVVWKGVVWRRCGVEQCGVD